MNEELFPKEKKYSIIVIDLWDENQDNAYKLLETDELEKTILEVKKEFNEGYYLMIYNRNGETVDV